MQAIAVSFYLVPVWLLLGDWMHWFNAVLMGVAVALTLSTGIEYLVNAVRHSRPSSRID